MVSLRFRVFDAAGTLRGAVVDASDAGVLVSHYGDGAEVRYGAGKGLIVWREGAESQHAGESYDFVAVTIYGRLNSAVQD